MTGYLPYSSIFQIQSPLTEKQLTQLDERCKWVQFCTPLSDRDLRLLADFLRNYSEIGLRVFGLGTVRDLDFLRVFQFLHRFEVDVWDIKSFAGIESLSRNLKFLGIGATKSKAHSLGFLSSFPQLEELYIEGHTKNIEAISGLKTLQKLTLRSVTLPNPDVLIPLKSLWWFALKLGGTKDLTKLPEVGHLKYLEIWMVKGLIDLDPISEVVSLQYLFLQALKRVTRLPSFKKLINLRRLHLQTMKGLNDLNPIIDSTSLEELVVCDAPHMKPQDFDVLVDHPSLKRVLVGLGSDKKNNAVNQKLPLGSINGFSMFDFEFI